MIICVGFGFIPKIWGKCRDSENTLSLLNCFSAGIFLAMSLIHMMPESAEIYLMWAKAEGIEEPFPLPYVMFFVGYLLILAIDRVAAKAYHAGHNHGDGKEGKPINANMMGASVMQNEDGTQRQSVQMAAISDSGKPDPFTPAIGGGDTGAPQAANRVAPGEAGAVKTNTTVSKTAAIILVLALGAHAFFEGIAFGLQTEVEQAG